MCFKYKYKFVGNRYIDINGIPPADIDDAFHLLQEHFDIHWLEAAGNNRIQRLWKEPYHLATIELYSLGDAIRRLSAINPKFVNDKVAEIKGNDEKTQNGAFFELFALNAFAARQQVIPAKGNNPGFDGTIALNKGKSVRLSIKNFSLSVHHETFLKEAEKIKDAIEGHLAANNAQPVEIIISKKSNYPTADDWKQLLEGLPGLIPGPNSILPGKLATGNIGDWGIIERALDIPGKTFASNPKSYTCIISSPFHKNEVKNLYDKVEEACANLIQHSKTETADLKNLVIVHLPRAASRKNCEQWAKDYLAMFPEKPISGILIYQPMVISNNEKKTSYLSQGFSPVFREQSAKDVGQQIHLQFPIGRLEHAYAEHAIFIQDQPGSAIKVELSDAYVYQNGNHYIEAKQTKEGFEGEMNKVASGVFAHSVVTVLGQKMAMSGRFEPVDMLEIL